MSAPVRVLLVEDDELVRGGIQALLAAHHDLAVVAAAGDGVAALEVLADLEVDLVVTDLRMPRMDGIELTRALREHGHRMPVLVLSTFDADPQVQGALRAGASGYLLKAAAARDLAEAIRELAGGRAWVDPGVAAALLAALRAVPEHAAPSACLTVLTDREREVLGLIGQGASNAEIAGRLWVGPGTVKTHVHRILHKTGCRDRAQLVTLAFTSGLLRQPTG